MFNFCRCSDSRYGVLEVQFRKCLERSWKTSFKPVFSKAESWDRLQIKESTCKLSKTRFFYETSITSLSSLKQSCAVKSCLVFKFVVSNRWWLFCKVLVVLAFIGFDLSQSCETTSFVFLEPIYWRLGQCSTGVLFSLCWVSLAQDCSSSCATRLQWILLSPVGVCCFGDM